MTEQAMEDTPGGRLRAERLKRGWTKVDLAKKLGTSTKTITRWENNEAVPGDDSAVRLCSVFGKPTFISFGFPRKQVAHPPQASSTSADAGEKRADEEDSSGHAEMANAAPRGSSSADATRGQAHTAALVSHTHAHRHRPQRIGMI